MAVRGLDNVRRQLAGAQQRVKTEVSAAAAENAGRVVGLAKTLAPRDQGNLVDSIRQEPGSKSTTVVVKAGGPLTTEPSKGGAFDYAPRTEFGGADEAEHPFFWPAVRALEKPMDERTARAVQKATDDSGGDA